MTVPVYPWPMHPKVAEVLEALPDLNLVEALPGTPGLVLAIKKAPPFACNAVVLSDPQKAAQAVDLVTENGIKIMTEADILGLHLLRVEAVEAKVRFS